MAELVGESLHVIGLHSAGIVDNIVVSRSDCALPHGLADQEKVVPETEQTAHCFASWRMVLLLYIKLDGKYMTMIFQVVELGKGCSTHSRHRCTLTQCGLKVQLPNGKPISTLPDF